MFGESVSVSASVSAPWNAGLYRRDAGFSVKAMHVAKGGGVYRYIARRRMKCRTAPCASQV